MFKSGDVKLLNFRAKSDKYRAAEREAEWAMYVFGVSVAVWIVLDALIFRTEEQKNWEGGGFVFFIVVVLLLLFFVVLEYKRKKHSANSCQPLTSHS